MKLYFSPGACSLAPHIVAREAGLRFELVKVDLRKKTLPDGGDYRRINPRGYVPALQLDDGRVLTEASCVVQFLADRAPEKDLIQPCGTFERYQQMQWLGFIATELHKQFGPLFGGDTPEAWKAAAREKIASRFDGLALEMERRLYLMDDLFTAPDAYLYVMLRWAPKQGIELERWPVLQRYRDRIEARPSVRAALDSEAT